MISRNHSAHKLGLKSEEKHLSKNFIIPHYYSDSICLGFFSALWFKNYRLNFWLDKRPAREERYQKEISYAHYRSFSNRLPAMIYWWCYFKYCLWQKHKYICKSGLAQTRNGKREVFHWHQYMLNLSISQSCLINKTQSPHLFGGSRPSFRVD